MNPFQIMLVALPLAAYFCALSWIHARSRPTVVSGGRDYFVLGLACIGVLSVGPLELFLPEPAAAHFRTKIRGMMLLLYLLTLTLVILYSRPRIVIYNITLEGCRNLLQTAIPQLDAEFKEQADCWHLPGCGVRLHLEPFDNLRVVSLIPTGGNQSINGWRALLAHLKQQAGQEASGRSWLATPLGAAGALLSILALAAPLTYPAETARALARYLLQAD